MKRDTIEWVVIAVLFATVVGCVALWHQRIYGDWTCMLSHCVRVKS